MESNMEGLIPDLDLNAEQQPDNDFELKDYSFDEAYAKKVESYNKNINNHDGFYKSFIPSDYRLLVRGYTKEMQITDEGVVIPNRETIGIPTKSNQRAEYDTITDPYGFTTKCVVVNVGSGVKDLKTGDIIYLSSMGHAAAAGAGAEIIIVPAGQFVNPDKNLRNMPEDPSDPDFGYFMITTADVLGCLKK